MFVILAAIVASAFAALLLLKLSLGGKKIDQRIPLEAWRSRPWTERLREHTLGCWPPGSESTARLH